MSVSDLHPWFVGAHGENHALLEELVVEMLRDHVFWRRNFHPESVPAIPHTAQQRADYIEFVGRLKEELYRLSADLKQSVPFFSPRYIGHMASDLVLPGLVARIATEFYNPNNVSEEASPVTLDKEVQVGEQLAVMLGYEIEGDVRAYGHITSGGTIANYEGLRNLVSARFFGLALREAAGTAGVSIQWNGTPLDEVPTARLCHLSVQDAIELHELARAAAQQSGMDDWMEHVSGHRYEALGLVEFHRRHPGLGTPCVMVATTAHYSWEKAMKLLGFGSNQLIRIPVDGAMRLDAGALRLELERAVARDAVVLAVVPILGSTEFGAIDPVHEVMNLREEFRQSGFEFGVHLDAAWGGYLRTLLKTSDGRLRPREEVGEEFRYFPSEAVYDAFHAVARTDSATVDPHKLGFIPFSAGAYIARDRRIAEFVRQDAAYVFDADAETVPALGQFSLEGSKPGAAVTSAYVTHRTIPLHAGGFGKIIAQSVRSCETFWDLAKGAAERLADVAHLVVPFEPDTNLVCIAMNPVGNDDVAVANAFTHAVMSTMRVDKSEPIQMRKFFVSSTRLEFATLPPAQHAAIFEMLALDPQSVGAGADDLLLLRHTLMNPWLLAPTSQGKTTIDLYFEYLEERVRAEAALR